MPKVQTRKTKAGSTVYFVRFRHGETQTSQRFDFESDAILFAQEVDDFGADLAMRRLSARENDATVKTPTMNELAAEHFATVIAQDDTIAKYRRNWDRTWGNLIGRTHAANLSKPMIEKALRELGGRYAEKSIRNHFALLTAVVKRGAEDGYLQASVVRGVRLPRGTSQHNRDDMRILSVTEFMQLEDAMDAHYRPLIRFLWGTGCRWGEATALTVGDIDWPNVRITKAVKSGGGPITVGTPKTKRSRRTIIMPDDLRADLAKLTAGREPDELLFPAKGGGYIRHRTFWDRYWKPAAESIGGTRPRIHDLRHSHASHLLASGVPIHVVSARLGHGSIAITVDTYGHLVPDAIKAAANAASLAFRPTPALDGPS